MIKESSSTESPLCCRLIFLHATSPLCHLTLPRRRTERTPPVAVLLAFFQGPFNLEDDQQDVEINNYGNENANQNEENNDQAPSFSNDETSEDFEITPWR
ncbi:hypothetical protein PIB30_078380 [Stylosanthes scabra]|uniref:Uncharacterized protein n=1 Tax=Stylosanthes scabra TaxID=79078 RepID=A0ABU6SR17_9FABA|nr:hypothetical protein [Stylosanthes scabra]